MTDTNTTIDPVKSAEALVAAKALFKAGMDHIEKYNEEAPPAGDEPKRLRALMTPEDNEKLDAYMDELTTESHSRIVNSMIVTPALRVAMDSFVEDSYLRILDKDTLSSEDRRAVIEHLDQDETLAMYEFVHSDVAECVIRNKLRSNGYDVNVVIAAAYAREAKKSGVTAH